jgi:DNA end-binding protein Ku
MAPRSSWKGFIKLSLVSVPVKAYTANEAGGDIHLNQLHAECNNRIRYLKTCPEHGEVSQDEIVSGYEYAKGKYVVIDLDELAKLRTQSDKSINIRGFVPPDALDARYHAGRTYYLVPDGAVGQKPYALLRQAMVDNAAHALATVVLAKREQLVLLRPLDNLLAMTVLTHAAKVKEPEAFDDEVGEQKLTPEELQLTKTLIDATRIADFDYSAYRDQYVDQLNQLIQAKIEGEEIVSVPQHEEPAILNLMEALKRSVAQAQHGDAEGAEADAAAEAGAAADAAAKPAARKMAPSRSGRARGADGRKKKTG